MSIDGRTIATGFRKYPVIFICAAITVALLVVHYFRADLLSAQQEELEQASAEASRYRSNLANSAQLEDQLAFLVEANKSVAERAMNPANLAMNLQYFYRLEAEAGVKYLDLRPVGASAARPQPAARGAKAPPPPPPFSYPGVGYNVNVQGSFPAVILYLRRLEQGLHFCRVNNASVSSAGGDTVTVNLNIDILGTP